MIRTAAISLEEVPIGWIFEYYCDIQEKLHGQDLKIKSLFKPEERTPSMCIYYTGSTYKFKDFSSGNQGTGVDLVMKLYNLSYYAAVNKILEDYRNNNIKELKQVSFKKASKFQVTSHIKRNWNELDKIFWTQYGIGSKLLKKYNVFPLQEYTLSKDSDNNIEEIIISGQYIYGYFTSSGQLYKVYQPKRPKGKFINVLPYVQGSDQLTYTKSTLVICSSLKDVMGLDLLDLDVEGVAPNSENTFLPKSVLSAYAIKYKRIVTFFDNDDAGRISMAKYKERYGIPGIHLKMSKDLSDSIRDHSIEKVKLYLKPFKL